VYAGICVCVCARACLQLSARRLVGSPYSAGNFEHSSSNHGLLCFISACDYPKLSLAEVLIPSLILFQVLLMSKLSSRLSKAANLRFLPGTFP
jgi:hypothetical protein